MNRHLPTQRRNSASVLASTFCGWLLLCGLASSVTGCGKSVDGYTGLRGTISGVISRGDEPVPAGCNILFAAASGPYTGNGVTDAAGRFTVGYRVRQGLPAGKYLVQITPPRQQQDYPSVDSPDYVRQMRKLQSEPDPMDAIVPKKYRSVSTSGLTFEVRGGDNVATFDLSPKRP